MSWRRLVWGSAALSLATTIGLACGDSTTNNVTVVNPPSEGGVDAAPELDGSPADPDAGVHDSGLSSDAPQDGPVADACLGDTRPTSNSCSPYGGPCQTACEANGSLVLCPDSGGGVRPPLEGCFDNGVSSTPGYQRWCCPPSCVAHKDDNQACDANHRLFLCPSQIPAGPPGCTSVGEIFTNGILGANGYCCPP